MKPTKKTFLALFACALFSMALVTSCTKQDLNENNDAPQLVDLSKIKNRPGSN